MADDAQRRDLAEKLGYCSAIYRADRSRQDDPPHRHYLRVLYRKGADPKSNAHWLARLKTSEMCVRLFAERQQARREWIASGPRRGRPELTRLRL
jgi:hypothetical protein